MIGSRALAATSTRWLMVGLLATGVLGIQSGRGTLAFFTASVASTGNSFTAGKIVLENGSFGQAGVSSAPILAFSSSGVTGTCRNDDATDNTFVATVNNSAGQRNLVPGDMCIASIQVSTTSTDLDIYYNITLRPTTITNPGPNTGLSTSAGDNLNKALKLGISELAPASCVFDAGTGAPPIAKTSLKAIGDTTGNGGWGAINTSTTVTLVGNPTSTIGDTGAKTLNAGQTATYCVAIYLPRGSGDYATDSLYHNVGSAGTLSAQGGVTAYRFDINAKQKPQT